MKRQFLFILIAALLFVVACRKEKSFEQSTGPAIGSLQSDATGDCLPKTVNGAYVASKQLIADSNTITVGVNVVQTGSYSIATDTINGFYFLGTGVFTSVGLNTITLKGNGTPFTQGTNNFLVKYDSSVCDVQVTVLPAGAGGPAVFTLAGAPDTCTNSVVAGTYATGTALTTANTVTINVNVTTIGTYNISTTYQGMVFSGAGTFGTTGAKTVTLTGSGTPTTGGINVVPLTVGATTCTFKVNVQSPANGTLGGGPGACTPSAINGTYTVGTALVAGNTVQVQITTTTAGAYSIRTDTVAGISFAASGTATIGTQTVTLVGTGTPTSTGDKTFTVKFGASTCTFKVTCLPAQVLSNDYFPRTANSNWSYELDDDALDSFYLKAITPTLSAGGNNYNIFMGDDGTGLDSSGYYRKSGADYYQWFDVGDFLGFDNPVWVEYVFLKDNVPAATNWKSAGFTGTYTLAPNPPQSVTYRFSYTIVDKDVSLSLTTSTGVKSHVNVISVKEEYEQLVGATWLPLTSAVGYGKSYYARGVGLIKYEVYNGSGALIGQQELRRSQVF